MKKTDLVLALVALNSHILKIVDRNLSVHGINLSEFLVMHHLSGAPALTMRRIDLAERVGLTASGVTRLLNPMEKIGLVEKESAPRDARVSLVKLSESGRRVLGEATVSFGMAAETLFGTLNDKQVDRFAEMAGMSR